jgi:hypothetical protein
LLGLSVLPVRDERKTEIQLSAALGIRNKGNFDEQIAVRQIDGVYVPTVKRLVRR